MNRHSLLLPAAMGAVLGAMLSLSQVFLDQRWLMPSVLAVGVAFGVGWVARRLDVPGILSPALSVLALVALLGLLFHRETTAIGLPTSATLRAIGESFTRAVQDIREQATPAEPTPALTLLATSGVYVVAAAVDLIVFRARRPVAAGLPLLSLFLIPTSMASHSAAWAFVAAAAGYLGLLVAEGRDRARGWGRRLSGIDVLDEVADVSHVARVGRRIGTAAIGIAICVPIAVPTVGKGIFTGAGGGPFGNHGGNSTAYVVNPIVEIRDQLISDKVITLFTVRTDDAQYLRLTTLNDFDGNAWNLVPQNAGDGHGIGGNKQIPVPDEDRGIATVDRHYEIDIGALTERWLPLPYIPVVVDPNSGDGDWHWEDTGLAVFSTKRHTNGLKVSVDAKLPQPTVDQLRAPGPIPRAIQRTYLAVPKETPKKAREVLDEVLKGKTTPYDKAVALNNWFFNTGHFVYDVNVASGTGVSDLTSFLTKRRGYCQQFAASMAYLARLAKIPARVVVGFTPGTPRADGTFEVTNHDAHAWPELYFANVGWVRFEPTPRTGVGVPSYALPPSTPSTPPDNNPSTVGPSASPTPSATPGLKGATEAKDDPNDPGSNAARRRGATHLPVLPIALLLAALALALPSSAAAAARWRRRRGATDHLGRIHAAWAALADAAEDTGYPLRAADSPRAAARRLVTAASLAGDPAAEVGRLAQAEERARYARTAPPVDGLDASARLVRKALRDSLRPVARLRAMAFPASGVRRLRDGARDTADAWARARDGARERVLSVFRRPARTSAGG